MKRRNKTTGARLRVVLEPDIALGPGKADLLQGIAEEGSIAAAGRAQGMSYKRAWGLVEEMNADFREPLVATSKGGSSHGGAALTTAGMAVLALYRRMEEQAAKAIAGDIATLRRMTADMSERK
ncbi:MAG: winged helix-turn-helix domain-containing protein [Flavobacteriaceae bacterium]